MSKTKNTPSTEETTQTENAAPTPGYEGPPIEELIREVEAAEARLTAALKFHAGQKVMYKNLPHKVNQRGNLFFLRCMVSKEALEAMKESGLMR